MNKYFFHLMLKDPLLIEDNMRTKYILLKELELIIRRDYSKVMKENFDENDWDKDWRKITSNIKNYKKNFKELENLLVTYRKENNKIISPTVEQVKIMIIEAKRNILPLILKIQEKTKMFYNQFIDEDEDKNNEDRVIVQDLLNDQELLKKRQEEYNLLMTTMQQLEELKQMKEEKKNFDLKLECFDQKVVVEDIKENNSNKNNKIKKVEKKNREGSHLCDSVKNFIVKYWIIIVLCIVFFVLGLIIGILI